MGTGEGMSDGARSEDHALDGQYVIRDGQRKGSRKVFRKKREQD